MTYNPLDPAVTANPYPHYARLRAEEPVKWIDMMQGFAVSRWDDVEEVLSDGSTFSSAHVWPALLGEFDPVPEDPPMIASPEERREGKEFVSRWRSRGSQYHKKKKQNI